MQIDEFERMVTALTNGDHISAISILEDEINREKQKNHHKVVMRLKKLLQTVSSSATRTGGASVSGYRYVHSSKDQDTRLYSIVRPETKLSEVVLDKENEMNLGRFLSEWTHFDDLQSHDLSPASKLLLYGPPGTGKTKLATAIANYLDFPLVVVFLDELISSYLGNTGKNLREVFEIARDRRVVIFLDEIDTIAKHRADQQDNGELKRIVTVFLQNLDMLSPGSIVIGATNHENLLDKAIWRRFPYRLKLDMPDYESRKRLITLFLGDKASSIDTSSIAGLTEGLSGSAIRDIAEEAIKEAIITNHDITTASILKNVLASTKVNSQSKRVRWSSEHYDAAKLLQGQGYSIRQIEEISGIPYTTLKGHLA